MRYNSSYHSAIVSNTHITNNLSKVDGESAALDFSSKGDISGASFKTSIGRMKGGYAPRTLPDKSRLAACFTNITEADLKPIMATVCTPPYLRICS
jgi:hypothetical protein